MRISAEFYLQRAEQSAREAEAADLANVRDRCLRAEAAWRAMAAQLQAAEIEKKKFALQQARDAEDQD